MYNKRFILWVILYYFTSLNILRPVWWYVCFRSFFCWWNVFAHIWYDRKNNRLNYYLLMKSIFFPSINLYLVFFRSLLEQHMHCHREMVSVRVFDCPAKDCLFSGRSAAELRIHQSTHSNEKNFGCTTPDCDYKTKTKALLNRFSVIQPWGWH